MSEYLDRLKHLRDATPPPGNAKNVQDNVSFRKAINYIEQLETNLATDRQRINNLENQERYLLTRLKEADDNRIPEELFDGHAVYENLQERDKLFIKVGYVSDVLDSVVRMIKTRLG